MNSTLHLLGLYLPCVSETPPPAYSPPEDSQQGQSANLTDPSAMDTTSSIMPEVAPVSYQVNVTKFCVLLNRLANLVHNQQMDVSFFNNPILFPICTSTFSILCKSLYNDIGVQWGEHYNGSCSGGFLPLLKWLGHMIFMVADPACTV
jgi:hypothetical protein